VRPSNAAQVGPRPDSALVLWMAELEAGVHGQDRADPTTWQTDDPLYRAAVWEYWAELAADAGCPGAAEFFRTESRAQLPVGRGR